jgi:transposase
LTPTKPISTACADLVADTAPELLALHGVGIDTAAALLVSAGGTPGRIRSEAARAHLCGVAPIEAFIGQGDPLAARPRR